MASVASVCPEAHGIPVRWPGRARRGYAKVGDDPTVTKEMT